MNVVFDHPAAAWALLGLPSVLAIHFLQERARHQRVSTLFLLEHLAPESRGGVRFEHPRQSLPMWLQLLAVLLIAWLLAGPRWLRQDSRQSIVIVLDDAVSMSAYANETRALLAARLRTLAAAAAHTEWTLLESDPAQPALYHGPQLAPLLASLARWQPQLGTHDPAPPLRLAQNVLRGPGLVVFVTNRAAELPGGIALLSAAAPRENCGFTGATIVGGKWRTLVKNYGIQRQTRAYWLRASGKDSAPQSLTLDPQQTLMLEGAFPAGQNRCELHLEDDSLAIDNVLPILIPQPKELTVNVTGELTKLVQSIPQTRLTAGQADVVFSTCDPAAPVLAAQASIAFPASSASLSAPASGWVIAAPHALTDGLNWSALLAPRIGALKVQPGDEVLVWHGSDPLILRRTANHVPHLLFNFAPEASNAARLPAFVLLIRRFLEDVRAAKIAPESLNVDTHQMIAVACDPQAGPLLLAGSAIPANAASTLRAPASPSFFIVKQGDNMLLDAAAQFTDVRESDLSTRGPVDTLRERTAQLVRAHTEADPLTPLWLLLLVAALLGSWAALQPRRTA